MSNTNLTDSLKDVTKAQLVAEFKAVIADAEALIKATAGQGGDKVDQVRSKAEASLASAKDKLDDMHEDLIEKGREAVKATDDYVQENPWKAVGIAAGIGLVIGLLVSRR
ncbi:DUF883 family protein [Candidatus Methylopumilus turicensis]|uniref:DUF883 domain-containing protein n=1 Tax=Candidatus Methylopumilus turicensis TaxID=1581680 RepID=A0A0B7IZP2_9PROT|nr:DUF883 family protein [Candidatus Methylopumilus turicensis]CEN55981.1 conserved protein of unknown function [Candidatus Methylopumilus turicensis]